MSRPTLLNLRNPDEHTPASYAPVSTYHGKKIDYQSTRHRSLKGSIGRDLRFSNRDDHDRYMQCGPNSYYPEESFKHLNKTKCLSKLGNPANKAQFANSNEYIMVGQTIKHVPQLKQFGAQSSQKKINAELNNKTDSLTVDLICYITKKERAQGQEPTVSKTAPMSKVTRNNSTINSAATQKKMPKSQISSVPTDAKLESTLDTLIERQAEAQNEAVDSNTYHNTIDNESVAKLQNDNSLQEIKNSQFSTGDLRIDPDRPKTEQKMFRPKIQQQIRGYSAANANAGKRNIKALIPSRTSAISQNQMKYDIVHSQPAGMDVKQRQSTIQSQINIYSKTIGLYGKATMSQSNSRQLKTAHSTKGFVNFDSNHLNNSIQSSLKTLFPPSYPAVSREGTANKSLKSYDVANKRSAKQQDFVKTQSGIFRNFENYEKSRSKQVEKENKFFSKNSQKSFNILRQKHLNKDQQTSKSSLLKSKLDGLNTISTGVEAPPNLELGFENLTIDSEINTSHNINKKATQKSKLSREVENYYKIPTFQHQGNNKNDNAKGTSESMSQLQFIQGFPIASLKFEKRTTSSKDNFRTFKTKTMDNGFKLY